MEKKNTKTFASAMKIMALLGGIFAIADIVFTSIIIKGVDMTTLIPNLLLILCLAFLVFSYNRHDKNLMNMMVGAVLTIVLIPEVFFYSDSVSQFSVAGTEMTALQSLHFNMDLVFIGILILAFVNHLMITFRHNKEHENPIIGVLLLGAAILIGLFQIIIVLIERNGDLLYLFNWISWYAMEIFPLCAIVFMELTLHEFKKIKEGLEE